MMAKRRLTMIHLTRDQHDKLSANGCEPVRVVDPVTNAEYILIAVETYAQLSGMIDTNFHVSDTYPAVADAVADLWNDPKMDDYDRYEEFRK
jgi:hypothetical protein